MCHLTFLSTISASKLLHCFEPSLTKANRPRTDSVKSSQNPCFFSIIAINVKLIKQFWCPWKYKVSQKYPNILFYNWKLNLPTFERNKTLKKYNPSLRQMSKTMQKSGATSPPSTPPWENALLKQQTELNQNGLVWVWQGYYGLKLAF